jgi:hypothetical protein
VPPNVSPGIESARSNEMSRIVICAARATLGSSPPNIEGNASATTAAISIAAAPGMHRTQNDVAIVRLTAAWSPTAAYPATYLTVAAPKPNSNSSRYSASEPANAQMPYSSGPRPRASTGVSTSVTTAMEPVFA